jgi:hypothetical protein
MNALTIGLVGRFDGEELRFSSPNENEVWAWIRGVQTGMKLKKASKAKKLRSKTNIHI